MQNFFLVRNLSEIAPFKRYTEVFPMRMKETFYETLTFQNTNKNVTSFVFL